MLKNLGTCTEIGYPVGAEITVHWSIPVACPIVLNRPSDSIGDLSNRHVEGGPFI